MSNMTTISLMMILIVVVVMMFDGSCHAYSMGNKMPHANDAMQSRQNFLKTAAAGFGVMMTATPPPAWAKDQTANAGTKKDPVFEQCLSQCMYECTKPKGTEQKSRKECLPDCKKECAKTDAQLMKGTPMTADKVDMGV